MDKKVEGRKVYTHISKGAGWKERIAEEHLGDGHYARQEYGDEMDHFCISTGRTVSLAQFEFARFELEICGHFPKTLSREERDDIDEALTFFVEELRDREEASLDSENEREVTEIPQKILEIVGACKKRHLMLAYGATLKGKSRSESHKFNKGWLHQIDDDADVLTVYHEMSEEMGERLNDWRKRINADENLDSGL